MRRRIAIGIVAAVLPCALFAFDFLHYAERALALGVDPAPADAILVPGGDPGFERTKMAAHLHASGFAPRIIFGGAGNIGDSATSMAEVARELGVPAEAIRLETTSRSTHECMHNVAPLVAALGVRRLLLVTSRRHLLRATLAARREIPNVEVIPIAASTETGSVDRAAVVREYMKLCYYALRGYL
jgi:uncharacterized SAM-binding protein YcdF (DUF218 family)